MVRVEGRDVQSSTSRERSLPYWDCGKLTLHVQIRARLGNGAQLADLLVQLRNRVLLLLPLVHGLDGFPVYE